MRHIGKDRYICDNLWIPLTEALSVWGPTQVQPFKHSEIVRPNMETTGHHCPSIEPVTLLNSVHRGFQRI
jgi:hypothetical protein